MEGCRKLCENVPFAVVFCNVTGFVTTSKMGYTKLFSSILASTIWNEESATRIVWITMLAMKDRDGVVEGSVPGLAVLARVTMQECERAIATLSAPDPSSRTKVEDGRRIRPCPEGWQVINHDLYQHRGSIEDHREKTRLRVQRFREREAASSVTVGNDAKRPVTVAVTSGLLSRSTDSEEIARSASPRRPKDDPDFELFWNTYDRKVGKLAALAQWKKIAPNSELVATIVEAAKAQVRVEPRKEYRKHPERWLRGRHWEDEVVTPSNGKPKEPPQPPRNVGKSIVDQAVIHQPDNVACECERCCIERRRASGYGERVKA